MKTLTLTTSLAVALAASLTVAAPAAADTLRKIDAGYWAKIDQDTAVVYDWSMRQRYEITFSAPCTAMAYGKGARLAETWSGKIDGSFRDRMIFGRESCSITEVNQLSGDEYKALVASQSVQIASVR